MLAHATPQDVRLFVPGRVCLFGEHSDWAGAYRRLSPDIPPGRVIIHGTEQGLHATARRAHGRLLIRSTLTDGTVYHLDMPLDPDALLAVARQGGFFSYAAGTAWYLTTFYQVDGIDIDNDETTLPVAKGLSSSAAFCVLVARAYNRVYDLRLTPRAEMEAAYQGEILTPSRCGRMDQGCAYGQRPVLMTFDGELLQTQPLAIGGTFHLLLADLGGAKDTVRILADLTAAYPTPATDVHRNVQRYLGEVNQSIVRRASVILAQGDPIALGRLMTEAQEQFDQLVAPACPSQLTAPLLHRVLDDPTVRRLSCGAKGVGSQGDGSVQFVTRDEAMRQQLADHLRDAFGMTAFTLDLKPDTRP